MTFKDLRSECKCLWKEATLNRTEEVLNITEESKTEKPGSIKVKDSYKMLVRSITEYCSVGWDPRPTPKKVRRL